MAVLEPDRRDIDISDPEQGISEEERKQILDQLERSIGEAAVPESTGLQPAKRGFEFPLFVNLAAAVVLLAVVFGAVRVFEVRREKLNLETREVASSEGKILDEFKREAEAKLKEKDAAIVRVLKQLSSLEGERSQLSRIMELRIQERERQMRVALEEELHALRQSLIQNGASATEADRQISLFEARRNQEIREELEEFQQQIDAVARQKEQELLREKAAAKASLEQATVEREELLVSTEEQQVGLLERIRPERSEQPGLPTGTAETGMSASMDDLVEELRRELREKEGEIESLKKQAGPVEEVDIEQIASRARRSAYEEVLATISRFETAQSEEELGALGSELASDMEEEPLRRALVAALQSLSADFFRLGEEANLSFRILGTVTLVGADSVTVLPMVDLPVSPGARIEIRRILPSGEALRVARGTLTEVRGGKLVARIEQLEPGEAVAVTDKVYLIVD
jgi:hypothetical protein